MSDQIIRAALDMRRSPLPAYIIPMAYSKLQIVYAFGFESGWRGWRLSVDVEAGPQTWSRAMYFRFTCRTERRRQTLQASYLAGQASLSRILRGKLHALGVQPDLADAAEVASRVQDLSARHLSIDLRELDLRRKQLPGCEVPDEDRLAPAYESGFASGFRGQHRLSTYRRTDLRNVWDVAYVAGEAVLQASLTDALRSDEYAAGFQVGIKQPKAAIARGKRSGAFVLGYEDGRRHASAPWVRSA